MFAFRASFAAAGVQNSPGLRRVLDKHQAAMSELDNATFRWRQHITYHGTEPTTIYTVNVLFIGLAVAASLLGVLALFPLYYGWWDLGRKVSLNPLETAKAFEAPLLKEVHSNAPRSKIVETVGMQHVRYGVMQEKNDEPRRLHIEENHDGQVKTPEPGSVVV